MKDKKIITTLAIIALIVTLPQIATDMYTPSLPAIAKYLHTTLGQAQLTMAFFIAGIAISSLIYGPISEVIGRRWTIILGIIIAIIGTIFCLSAQNIHVLQAGRFIQGCGLGACAALWRPVFRDTFSGEALARIGSYFVIILTVSVMISPFIGGYFEQYLGWRSTFIFLFCWMIIVLLLLLSIFKETSQHHGKHRLSFKFVFQSYAELLGNRVFMGFSLMSFLAYGGLITWLTAGPVVLIHGAGISPVAYGYLMILSGIGTGMGGFVNGKLTKKISLPSIVFIGMSLMTLSGIIMLLSYYMFGLNIYVVIIPAIIFTFSSTFIFINCFALGFENVGHIAGYAGSLYACIQLLGGVLFSAILGALNTNSPISMGSIFLLSGMMTFLTYKTIVQ